VMIFIMKWLQKTTTLLVIAGLLLNTPASYAYNKLYHTYSTSSEIAPGVTLTSEQRMTDSGWFNVNIVKMDLTNESVKSTVLLPESISQKATLSNLVKTEDDIVAAINGDFFDTQGQSTLGMVVKDGEYITSSIHDDRFYTYLQLKDGRSYIAKVLGESTKFTKSGFSLDITYKNKPYLQYDRAISFDKSWGTTSIGNKNSEPVIEVVVDNDIIQSIDLGAPPQTIPENGYVISAVGSLIPVVMQNFKVGDSVELSDGGFLSHIDQAIGGGAKILSDGLPVTDFSLNISGRHPRSGLGFSEDNKTLFLMTIDGRSKEFTGMTQTELAYLMAEVGAWNAINLDGGGSSELIAKPTGTNDLQIINQPSEGVERRIHNAIGIKNIAPRGPLNQILLELNQDRYFVKSGIQPEIRGLDANLHAVNIDNDSIQWTVTGVNHTIDNGTIIPLESGDMKLQASLGTATGEITIPVIGEPTRISVSPQTARLMPGDSLNITLTGYDKDGFSAPLKLEDVDILQTGLDGSIDNNKYTVTEPGSGYIRFSLGDAEAFMSIGAGESTELIYDFEQKDGSFVSYPETVTGSYNLTKFAHTGDLGGTLQYDFRNDVSTRAAYLKFDDSGIILPENSSGLKLWVFGDYANGHWLRGKVSDTSGEVYTVDFAKKVDWTGWKQVEAILPVGVEIQSLDRLYLVETDPAIRDLGVIVFDDLEAIVTSAPPTDLSSQSASNYSFESLDQNQADVILQIGALAPSNNDDNTINDDNSTGESSENPNPASPQISFTSIDNSRSIYNASDSIEIITLDNTTKMLSRTSDTGWSQLLSHVPAASTTETVVLFNGTYGFKNQFDEKLFKDTLNTMRTELGQRITVISPGSSDQVELKDGIWFVSYKAESITQVLFDMDADELRVGKQTLLSFDD